MSVTKPRVLFVGVGSSAVAYYRCALPALFGGWDWVGILGVPPKIKFVTGLVGGKTEFPHMSSYDVVVIQQPRGPEWGKVITDLQDRGVKVIFEVDDYLHGIRDLEDHDFRQSFGLTDLASLEENMRLADAIITSTAFIAMRYRAFNPRTFVAENCLDLGRYRLTRPPRPSVNVGWAGATGHVNAAIPWWREVAKIMDLRENVCAVSIGQDFAKAMNERFPGRGIAIPWTLIDTYPSAMTLLDVAMAPAGDNDFFRGKSDLRWIEAGALGIPIVADPDVYPDIEPGVTGFHASSPESAGDLLARLVDDPSLRLKVGAQAQEHVLEHRDMAVGVQAWRDVIDRVLS